MWEKRAELEEASQLGYSEKRVRQIRHPRPSPSPVILELNHFHISFKEKLVVRP